MDFKFHIKSLLLDNLWLPFVANWHVILEAWNLILSCSMFDHEFSFVFVTSWNTNRVHLWKQVDCKVCKEPWLTNRSLLHLSKNIKVILHKSHKRATTTKNSQLFQMFLREIKPNRINLVTFSFCKVSVQFYTKVWKSLSFKPKFNKVVLSVPTILNLSAAPMNCGPIRHVCIEYS